MFTSNYEFPLLHPVSFNQEDSYSRSRNENALLREKEIDTQISVFKRRQYSLEKLVVLAIKENKKQLGEVLAQFYCG